jgi:hypothetical protein
MLTPFFQGFNSCEKFGENVARFLIHELKNKFSKFDLMLTLDVMYLNDAEYVFHQHLIVIKAAYFMFHKVGRGFCESFPRCPCFRCAMFLLKMTMVANSEAITKEDYFVNLINQLWV